MKKIKIARIVTIPITYVHIINLLETIDKDERFELHLICSRGDYLNELMNILFNSKFHFIDIPRDINLISDLVALVKLTRLFLKEKFDIVHSHTPKAGVTSALAGFISGTPIRIHTFTGQVWATLNGAKKFLLINLDRMIGFFNTHNYADSHGQKKILLEFHIGNEISLTVLHKGSFGGIDANRFSRDRLKNEIFKLKSSLFGQFDGKILIYLGRMNAEKGLFELAEAFYNLRDKFNLKLLLVGPIESQNNIEFSELIGKLKNERDVVYLPYTAEPEVYLGVADIYCFPSYREGFGTVALEASAMELPVVASNVYGLSDAVLDEVSGLLFKLKNVDDLTLKIEKLLSDPAYAQKLGIQGRRRVLEDFSEKLLTEKMIAEYEHFLKRGQ